MNTYKLYTFKFIVAILCILNFAATFEARADSALEVVGIYVDSTASPHSSLEIIVYKQDGRLAGTWNQGYPNPENRKGFPYEIYPIENIRIGSNGSLSFTVLWDIYSGFKERKAARHHFTGHISNNIIQGYFISDDGSPNWSPDGVSSITVNALIKNPADLKQNTIEYVLTRHHAASEYKQRLDKLIECQITHYQLPTDAIEVTGFWSIYGSDGEHEWGYDVVLFKVGNTQYGWLEDYAGMIADGGIRYLLRDIRFSNQKLTFKTHDNVEYKSIVKNKHLELSSLDEVTILKKQKPPEANWVWKQYQALNVKCGKVF